MTDSRSDVAYELANANRADVSHTLESLIASRDEVVIMERILLLISDTLRPIHSGLRAEEP